jgi:hypothetical protein
MAGDDRRFSSYAREIDAAIERVVAHFEENDVALRLDVLRGLAAHAKLAFESERIKQRLAQHPVAKELIENVTTASTVFARLHSALVVEQYSCEYDRHRNVEMRATVRWSLPAEESKASKNKKQKTGKRRARVEAPLFIDYTFTRTADQEDGETIVKYVVALGVGADAERKSLVQYELASDSAYPRSFYEEDHDEDSDDDEGGDRDGGGNPKEESEKEAEGEEEEVPSNDEEGDDGEQQKDEFGEQIRSFDFHETVFDTLLEWLQVEDDEELDPADVVGFFLSLPMYEDDWMIDERVCQILFNAGGMGGDSEMEEEIVSDFDGEDEN